MRKPNHIILDFENNKNLNSSSYWALDYLANNAEKNSTLNNLDIHKKYLQDSYVYKDSSVLKSQQKFTVRADDLHEADLLRSWEKEGLTKMFKPSSSSVGKASKYLLKYSQHKGRDFNTEESL